MLFGGISSLNCSVLGLFDAFDKNCFIWVDGVKNLVWGDKKILKNFLEDFLLNRQTSLNLVCRFVCLGWRG